MHEQPPNQDDGKDAAMDLPKANAAKARAAEKRLREQKQATAAALKLRKEDPAAGDRATSATVSSR